MDAFLKLHGDAILGTLSAFDRLNFKGHLTHLFPAGSFAHFLSRQGVLLKDFGSYVENATREVKLHAQRMAQAAGRPFLYLESATTKRSGQSKEDLARKLAEEQDVREGLICVFSVLESCNSFVVRKNPQTHRLQAMRRPRKCLHFYFYFLDPEFGLMHVRLQSWFPFSVQICLNGRSWLARQLEKEGIAYAQYANAFTWIEDLPRAQALCERFVRRRWPHVLQALARQVNPHLELIQRLGFGSYYWVTDQAEYATDVMFQSREAVEVRYGEWLEYATTCLGAEDVLRFLGRKLSGNFRGEVTTERKRRPEGRRIKHRMKNNSLKMYDKASVLRIETTINNPREFKVLRVRQTAQGRSRRWCPMGKGVAHLWRYAQVSQAANGRYLEALAQVPPKGKVVEELDRLCRPRTVAGKRFARLHPFSREDTRLFQAVLAGDHTIRGFRNGDLQAHLYAAPASSMREQRRRGAQVSRLIRKLRAHQLVAKVPGCRRYRVTNRGYSLMAAAVRCRTQDFPHALLRAA